MSDRETSGDTATADTPQAYYTLELEFTRDSGLAPADIEAVTAHSLQNGFLVVKCQNGECWYRASEILLLNKYTS